MTKEITRQITKLLLLIITATALSGCSSIGKKIRDFITGVDSDAPVARVADATRFSENENMKVEDDKKYRRMNRQRLEDESELGSRAGSLWVMEGQGAYLFSQNQTRMIGDLLNVKIEGNPRSQLQAKAKVIAKLLDRLDHQGLRGLASESAPAQAAPAEAPAAPPAGAEGTAGAAAPVDTKNDPMSAVQVVPTRITEQLKDGSYRVRGVQPFMIGKREYKVIVTGIVRPEDFDDAGIAAPKLLDPQFDIVSSKKGST